jgi:hypothetical protein
MNDYHEILHEVSECCSAPCKYRKGETKTGEEIFVPFCCKCELMTQQVQKRLSSEQIKQNKIILSESIFPGITKMFPDFTS